MYYSDAAHETTRYAARWLKGGFDVAVLEPGRTTKHFNGWILGPAEPPYLLDRPGVGIGLRSRSAFSIRVDSRWAPIFGPIAEQPAYQFLLNAGTKRFEAVDRKGCGTCNFVLSIHPTLDTVDAHERERIGFGPLKNCKFVTDEGWVARGGFFYADMTFVSVVESEDEVKHVKDVPGLIDTLSKTIKFEHRTNAGIVY